MGKFTLKYFLLLQQSSFYNFAHFHSSIFILCFWFYRRLNVPPTHFCSIVTYILTISHNNTQFPIPLSIFHQLDSYQKCVAKSKKSIFLLLTNTQTIKDKIIKMRNWNRMTLLFFFHPGFVSCKTHTRFRWKKMMNINLSCDEILSTCRHRPHEKRIIVQVKGIISEMKT